MCCIANVDPTYLGLATEGTGLRSRAYSKRIHTSTHHILLPFSPLQKLRDAHAENLKKPKPPNPSSTTSDVPPVPKAKKAATKKAGVPSKAADSESDDEEAKNPFGSDDEDVKSKEAERRAAVFKTNPKPKPTTITKAKSAPKRKPEDDDDDEEDKAVNGGSPTEDEDDIPPPKRQKRGSAKR